MMARARALLDACAANYITGDMSEDIPTWKQTIETYRTAVGQRKYVHMYFAKSVACWRDLRQRLQVPNDGDVVSVGAGPCLCLFGWFWDTRPASGQDIRAVDVLDWQHVLGLPEHRDLRSVVFEAAGRLYYSGRYFPNGAAPPQASGLVGLRPLEPQDVVEGSTVLIPFVLNHLVGKYRPVRERADVFSWLETVRMKAKRVLIIDMQFDDCTREFWAGIQVGLAVSGTPSCLNADCIEDFSSAYSDDGDRWPSRRTNHHMRRYTAVVGDADGWWFV